MAAARLAAHYHHINGNDTSNMLPPSPSKERRRSSSGKLRFCLVILSFVLVASLLVSQALFWTRREDLESAVEYALHYANEEYKYLESQVESAVGGILNDVDKERRNENRSMQVYNTLISSQTTVVTAYFQLKSKYPSEKYDRWMRNMLSIQDAMVIFTSPDLVDTMQHHRSHAKDRTVIISMPLEHVPMAQDFSTEFWQHQLDIDPEQSIHQGFALFWIWLSKSWFVLEAIERNYFDSTIFMWSDIGCFRMPRYRGKRIIRHIEMIPRHSILQMAHHEPNPPPNVTIWNDKYREKQYFYHSGSQAVGYADTWRLFHEEFLKMIQEFIARDFFIGEDQTVLQSTCLVNPNLCAYVPFTQVTTDNHYFGLRHVLHHGGNYTYWRPPGATTREEAVTSTL